MRVGSADEPLAERACVRTKAHIFCIGPDGRIDQVPSLPITPQSRSRAMATARPGTRIVATDFGDHEIVAYLAEQKTPDGPMLQAFAFVDGASPIRISEDGAGATSVDVAPRGRDALIAYLDARGAMAPAHARVLRFVSPEKLELGKDAIIFIGGAPDPYVAGVLGTTSNDAFYFLPIAKDTTTFGMAVVRIDDPPRDDEPVTWAMYPSGIDPAPIAATHGVAPIRVARVIPRAPTPGAPQAIELGDVQPNGVFRSLGIAAEPERGSFLGLKMESGKLILKHGDSQATTIDVLRCPG